MSGASPPYSSPVARQRTQISPWIRVGGPALCVAGICAFAGWMVWKSPRPALVARAVERSFSLGADLPHPPASRAAPAEPPRQEKPTTEPAAAPTTKSSPAEPETTFKLQVWEADPAVTTAAEQVRRERGAARATRRQPGPMSQDGGEQSTAAAGGSDFSKRMQHTTFANAAPEPMRLHPHYTIRKNYKVPCTPAQPIASNLPGSISCLLDEPVLSMDGTNVILPKGSQVNGTIEKGLSVGEERLWVVWTDALTPLPEQIAIPLEAYAADELGQSGVPGEVDDHTWKRIKGALLLSLVELPGQLLTGSLASGHNNAILNLGGLAGSTTSSLSQMAFQRDMNIQPTLYRDPGQPLIINVPNYVDLYKILRDVPL